MLILIALGMLDKNAPFPFFDWSQIRLGSVLGRIGLACFVTVVLYLNFNSGKRLYIIGGTLLLYYACVLFIPVPGYGAGDLTFEGNLIGWIDRTFLPGRLLQGTYDELGIITQFPAICLTLLGAFAGEILKSHSVADNKKFIQLTREQFARTQQRHPTAHGEQPTRARIQRAIQHTTNRFRKKIWEQKKFPCPRRPKGQTLKQAKWPAFFWIARIILPSVLHRF